MAKIARPAQETPEFLGQSLCYCVLIEKLTKIFRRNFQQHRDTANTTIITYKCYLIAEIKIFLPIAGNPSNSCTIDHIVWWTTCPPLYCIFIKIHVFFSCYFPGSLITSSSTWFNTLYQSLVLTFMNTVYFVQKLYCIS